MELIELNLVTNEPIWLACQHIASVRANRPVVEVLGRSEGGSLIVMSNGDQWAVTEHPTDVIAGWSIR